VMGMATDASAYRKIYADVGADNPLWDAEPAPAGAVYQWDTSSTYIQEPPFFLELTPDIRPIQGISGARALAVFGDSITTDHISPAGSIAVDGPAGKFLVEQGVAPRDFNSYGSRRGNDRVMTRGTFANIRLKNLLVPGIEGGVTIHMSAATPDGVQMSIYDAAMQYRQEGVPLVVLAGKEYGSGSSRDWAAKGTLLLGVKAVITESFERIHRSNLIGMGVLPLVFKPGDTMATLGLSGKEVFSIEGLDDAIKPQSEVTVRAVREDDSQVAFQVIARLNTAVEVEIYRNGGILQRVLRNLLEG
jgi:aconitate hydratase